MLIMLSTNIEYVQSLSKIDYEHRSCDDKGNAIFSKKAVAITPASNGTIIIKDSDVTHIKVNSSSKVKLVLDHCPNLEYIELPGANSTNQVENQVIICEKGKATLQDRLLINGTMKEFFAIWGIDDKNPFVINESYDHKETAKGLVALLNCGFIGKSWDIDLSFGALQVDLLVVDQSITSNHSKDTIELNAQFVVLKNFSQLERVCITNRVRCLYLEDCCMLTSVIPTVQTVKSELDHHAKEIQAHVNVTRKKSKAIGTCSLSVLDIVNCPKFNYYLGSTTYLGLTRVNSDTVQIKGKIDTLWSSNNSIRSLVCVAPEKIYFAGKGVGDEHSYCSIQNIYADKLATKAQPNCCIYADDEGATLPYLDGPFFDANAKENQDLVWAPATREKTLYLEWNYMKKVMLFV
jgi:hypothetical protein